MADVPKEVLWYGKNETLPATRTLRAGILQLDYQAGKIRNIRYGDTEILRMLYVALRDSNWGTIDPEIMKEEIYENESGFRISYVGDYNEKDVQFTFRVSIEGDAENNIKFIIDGLSHSTFKTNRVGLNVLYPIKEYAGKTGIVISPDKRESNFTFPKLISPHQPVKNIAALRWDLAAKASASLTFEGEIFEMEDQRNWTDDSYKVYCRPLEWPFPYTIKKGDKIQQAIRLKVDGKYPIVFDSKERYDLTIDQNSKVAFPSIGIGRIKGKLSENDIELIRSVGFDYYDVEVNFEGIWIRELKRATLEAQKLEMDLAIRAVFSEEWAVEIVRLSEVLAGCSCKVASLLILQKGRSVARDKFIDAIIDTLRKAFPGVKIGAGTKDYFAELNRNRIKNKELDFLSYSICPQVHANDNLTLIENLNGQEETVLSAKVLANGREVQIRSVTFKMQTNPAATNSESDLCDQVDPRQMSLFGAGWTMGSIKKLASARVGAITYFETVGLKGIVYGDSESEYNCTFPAKKGAIYPMLFVFRELLYHKTGWIFQSNSSHPLVFDGLIMECNGEKLLVVANYTEKEIEVRIRNISLHGARIKILDEKNMAGLMNNPGSFGPEPWDQVKTEASDTVVKMRAYAVAIIKK